jgi:hypothetical protein
MQSALAPEDQLILLLARGNLLPRVQEGALALLAAPLRWDLIVERVKAQEVYPLFYRNLGTLGFPGVPQQARAQLHNLSRINALRNTLLTEELVRALILLAEAGIPTIPLKGMALAESLYGDTAMRACVDIDILVPRRSVPRAFHLLLAAGYKSEFTSGFFADLLLRHNIEYALVREDRGFRYMLELHWDVLWGGQLDEGVAEGLWAEAQPTTVFGARAYALSSEWQILFLAAHIARHQWQGLKWLVDIHEICSSREVNWEKVLNKAKRLGWEELLRLTFQACHALFDTPVPANLSRGVLPRWLKIFPSSASVSWKGAFLATRLLRSPSAKLRYAARVFLVPTLAEHRLVRFPSLFAFLYYPLRLLRLGSKWSWSLIRYGFRGAWSSEQGARSLDG